MEEMNLLENLDRVKAPPDFEQRVMAQLSLRKRAESRRRVALRLTLAGTFASLLVVGVLLSVLVLPRRSPLRLSGRGEEGSPVSLMFQTVSADTLVPVIETLDYTTEIRSRSREPEAVYLLEQVSETTPRGITY
jgi:hypothetical protein